MSISQSEALSLQLCSPSLQSQNRICQQLAGIEISLMEARSKVVSVLDREISEVRALKKMMATHDGSYAIPSIKSAESCAPVKTQQNCTHPMPLPDNVVAISREFFTATEPKPMEMALDPELERATIEELNAALAAAFSHISAR